MGDNTEMIALYLASQNVVLTDATGDDVQFVRSQYNEDYPPKIIKVKRLTITHRMSDYVQATVTFPDVDKPIFITHSGGTYSIYEKKETPL